MENNDIFVKELREAIGEENIKLLIKYINKQIEKGVQAREKIKN